MAAAAAAAGADYAYSPDDETERRYQVWLSRFNAEDASIYADVYRLVFKHRPLLPPLMAALVDRLQFAISTGISAPDACGQLHRCLTLTPGPGTYATATRFPGTEERLVSRRMQYAYAEIAALSERSFEFGTSIVCDLYERLMACFNPDITVEYGLHFAENATALEDLLADLSEMTAPERQSLLGWHVGVRIAGASTTSVHDE